jgi:hypothetical protein
VIDVTKLFSHPDESRRRDPNLTVEDFDVEALMTKEYMLNYAAFRKKNKAKRHELTTKIVPSVEVYAVTLDGTKVKDYRPEHIKPLSAHVRRFVVDKVVHYFLNIRMARELAAKGCSTDNILPRGLPGMLTDHCKRMLSKLTVTESIPDTIDTPEMEPAPGFKLTLRSYQKRTLNWLVDLETHPEKRQMDVPIPSKALNGYQDNRIKYYDCLQLGEDGPYLDLLTNEVVYHNPSKTHQVKTTITCNGAILADDTGTGEYHLYYKYQFIYIT